MRIVVAVLQIIPLLLAFPLAAQRARLDTLAASPPLSGPNGVLAPVSAFFDDRGGVWITDLSEAEVGVLDIGSKRWGIVGRRGSGPGEFQAPIQVGQSGDSIWVYDSRLRRLSYFRRMRFVGSTPLSANLAAIDGTPEFLTVGEGPSGVSVVRSSVRSPFGALGIRGTIMSHSLDNTGSRGSHRSLFVVESPSTEIVFPTRAGGVAVKVRAQHPFLFSPLIVGDGTGGVVVLTQVGELSGSKGRLRMTLLRSSGVEARHVIELTATPISSRVRDEITANFCTVAGPASAQPICDRAQLTRALGKHEYLPLVTGAVACQESSGLWLQRANWPLGAPVEYRFVSGHPPTARDFVFPPGTRIIGCVRDTVALVQMEGRSAVSPVVVGRVPLPR